MLYLILQHSDIQSLNCFRVLRKNCSLASPKFFKMVKNVINLEKLSEDEKRRFREKYDVFFFDMDGTIAQLDKTPIIGVKEGIAALERSGKLLYLFTDTDLYTREKIGEDLKKDYPAFRKGRIFTASYLLTEYLKKCGINRKIYAMGEQSGLIQDLKDAGFEVLADTEPHRLTMKDLIHMKLEKDIGAVVVGSDINFSYLKLMKAVNFLTDPTCLFLVVHKPIVALYHPIVPAAGSLALPIEIISGRKATSCCKSSTTTVDYIKSLGYDMKRCLFVGDGLMNDITCGNRCGMDTTFVLSGTSSYANMEKALQENNVEQIPTYYANSVAVFREIYDEK